MLSSLKFDKKYVKFYIQGTSSPWNWQEVEICQVQGIKSTKFEERSYIQSRTSPWMWQEIVLNSK